MSAHSRRTVQALPSAYQYANRPDTLDAKLVAREFSLESSSQLADMFTNTGVELECWQSMMGLLSYACKNGADGPALQHVPINYACLQVQDRSKAVLHVACTSALLVHNGPVVSDWVQNCNLEELQTLPPVVLLEQAHPRFLDHSKEAESDLLLEKLPSPEMWLRARAALQAASRRGADKPIIAEDYGPGSDWATSLVRTSPDQHLWLFKATQVAVAPFPMLTALIIKELGSLPRELQCRHLKLLHINHIDGHQHITELPEFGNLLDLTHLQVVHSSTAAIPSSYLVSNKLVNIYFCLSHRDCKPDVKHNQELTWFRTDGTEAVAKHNKELIIDRSFAQQALRHLYIKNIPFCTHLPSLCNLTRLECLRLDKFDMLQTLPDSLEVLCCLTALELSQCPRLTCLPPTFSRLTSLRLFSAFNCKSLKMLPPAFSHLQQLVNVKLDGCGQLKGLPDNIVKLNRSLSSLSLLDTSNMAALPEGLGDLTSLHLLALSHCTQIVELPTTFSRLHALQGLTLTGCTQLTNNLQSLGQLHSLTRLVLSHNCQWKALPDSVTRLALLQELNLGSCSALLCLPQGITSLTNLKKLNLTACSSLQLSCTLSAWLLCIQEYQGPMAPYVLVMANGTFLPRQRPHQPRQLPVDLMRLGKPGEAKRWLTEHLGIQNFARMDLHQTPSYKQAHDLQLEGFTRFEDELPAEAIHIFNKVLSLIPLLTADTFEEADLIAYLMMTTREYMIAAFIMAELERVSEQDPKSAAELALYATRTRLSSKHAAQMLLSAAHTNFDAGNFETCAKLCRDSRIGSDTKMSATSELLLQECATCTDTDRHKLDYDEDRWLGLCCLSFKPVYRAAEKWTNKASSNYVECPYTKAVFQPCFAGELSPFGGLTYLGEVQSFRGAVYGPLQTDNSWARVWQDPV